MIKLTRKQKWYFLKQDITSYSISSAIYIFLCLIENFSLQSLLYAIFDCLSYYISFWFIRINFDDTYHDDKWKKCRFYTRLMLNIGVSILWLLPFKYSIFNSILVAFLCCLILYLIKIAVKKDIWSMNEDELYNHCRNKGLSDGDCKIAYFIVYERLKGKELYKAINYSEIQTKRKRKEILKKIQ